MMALVYNDETNGLESGDGNLLHGECLEHGDHYILSFKFTTVSLDASDASIGKEHADSLDPLIA
jgi:hypothetical protein